MLSYMQPEDGLEYQTTAPEYPAAEQLQTEQCYKQNKERRIARLFLFKPLKIKQEYVTLVPGKMSSASLSNGRLASKILLYWLASP